MFKSIKYVVKENVSNIYRIYCIAKYELLADMRDSKFGLFWNFASPAIQVLTYFLVFGIGIGRGARGAQEGIPYLPWVVVGFCAWWFIQPSIVQGCSAIFSKTNVITKMKFPVSILPMTIVAKELFNHFCMIIISFVVLFLYGYYPNVYWFSIIYYVICAVALVHSLSMITSVLTMMWRDVKKLVVSLMRMLLYLSPVLWPVQYPDFPVLNFLMKLNPVYYVVQGYRESIFFGKTVFDHPVMTIYFWCVIVCMFVVGCYLMHKFKKKFIDMI